MKFLLSLDYELFFGSRIGTVQNCLIEPVNALLQVCEKSGLRLTLFVDAGFLVRLRQESQKFTSLVSEYDMVRGHLSQLKEDGHDIQLHIHPHWVDSYYDGSAWVVDTSRYKLHDFSQQEISDIVRQYKTELTDIAGEQVFAYRGGGWCIQPFEQIAPALLTENVWLESTVFYQGKSEDSQRGYDFSNAPDKDYWPFFNDPAKESGNGRFVEVPISSFRVRPAFFWRMALVKKMGGIKYQSFGDGRTMVADKQYYISRLTKSTNSVASIDGLKSSLLPQAYKQLQQTKKRNMFHVMGHPKSFTPHSIAKLFEFLEKKSFDYITFQKLQHLKPVRSL